MPMEVGRIRDGKGGVGGVVVDIEKVWVPGEQKRPADVLVQQKIVAKST